MPELPTAVRYLWVWFNQLVTGEPLSYSDIASWAGICHLNVHPKEAEALIQMDITRRNVSFEALEKRSKHG